MTTYETTEYTNRYKTVDLNIKLEPNDANNLVQFLYILCIMHAISHASSRWDQNNYDEEAASRSFSKLKIFAFSGKYQYFWIYLSFNNSKVLFLSLQWTIAEKH